MAVEHHQAGANLIDVLDRVLDKGIVIDGWGRLSVMGIDLITVEARVVVASIHTHLRYTDAVGSSAVAARSMPSFARAGGIPRRKLPLRHRQPTD